MEDRDTRYSLRGMVELDDTYIGGKKKPGKRGHGARSKVPVMVAVEFRPQGCGHVGLRKMEPLHSQQTRLLLQQEVHHHSRITSDGLHLYRPLAAYFDITHTPFHGGRSAVKVFPMCTG